MRLPELEEIRELGTGDLMHLYFRVWHVIREREPELEAQALALGGEEKETGSQCSTTP